MFIYGLSMFSLVALVVFYDVLCMFLVCVFYVDVLCFLTTAFFLMMTPEIRIECLLDSVNKRLKSCEDLAKDFLHSTRNAPESRRDGTLASRPLHGLVSRCPSERRAFQARTWCLKPRLLRKIIGASGAAMSRRCARLV